MTIQVARGNCLDILPSLPDGSVNLVCADLPYGVTQNKWDSVIPFAPLWSELLRIGKRNCAYVFFATQPFATTLINSQPKLFRYDLIWEKSNPVGFFNANKMPLRAHEHMLVFGHTPLCYSPQKTLSQKTASSAKNNGMSKAGCYGAVIRTPWKDDGTRFPKSVLQYGIPEQYVNRTKEIGRNVLHPTQKPVALLEWLIKTYSTPGDLILDPTMGSGTTGVACANTGRRFFGIEQDATYYKVARKRIGNAA